MPSPGLQSFVGSWYSVVAYGAGGAGNTNDTTAIQAAMTAANANGGGTVVVPAGTYRLDSSLSWTGLTNVCLWLGTGASFTGVGTVTAASGTNNSIFDQRTSGGGGGGGGGGTVTSVTGTSPISVATGTTTPAISFDGTAALSQSNTITGTAVGASGLTGAANAVRIVGRNASGTPASGTFAVGDVVINTDGTEYVCTVAGTPGTWVALNPGYGTPVNIDASLTSLSAGSLTTVARADHVHTVTNACVLISSVTLASAAATITLSNIPSTFRMLMVDLHGRSAKTGIAYDTVKLTFNSDTSASYGVDTSLWTYIPVCLLPAATALASPMASSYRFFIWGYSNSNWYSQVTSHYSNLVTDTKYSQFHIELNGQWRSTANVTSLTLALDSAGNFAANTVVALMGVP